MKHTIQAALKRAEGNLERARIRLSNHRSEHNKLMVEVWRVLVERARRDVWADRLPAISNFPGY